jgi:hypothetical protein
MKETSGGQAVRNYSRFARVLLFLLTACPPVVAAQVPTPHSHLGFRVGQDSMLASWSQITGYFAQLALSSPRVRVDTIGRSTQGRPLIVATISDPANLARRAAIMTGQRQLADPRYLSPSDERRLVASQPAVILIQCSIHSTEIAASQMAMELAWRLATDSAYAGYLRNVVVLLIPSPNPDGVDIVGDWYRASRHTAWDGSSPPWLYHPYVGHDNNRDWFMLTQVETRHVTRLLYREWFPLVFYDVHQMGSRGSRMFVPPFADPVNPNLDPAIVAGINLAGVTMAQALLDAGHTGIAHQERFDLWWHGGARSTPTRHNMIGILSEAASARLATPLCLAPDSIRQPPVGVNYPVRWRPRCWRLRDIVDYELVTSAALIRLASDQRAEFVQRFVTAGRRAIEAGRAGPAAFILPAVGDQGRRAHLANLLLATGVEVHRARAGFSADGRTFDAGALVVRMDQPFRAHAKDLLEIQRYPQRRAFPGGPQIPPYDVAGWTLPLQMDVEAVEVESLPRDLDLERLDTVTVAPGRVAGRGEVVLLDNRANAHVTAVWRALAAGGSVQIAPASFTAAGREWPAGTLIVRGVGARAAVEAEARRAGFEAVLTDRVPVPETGMIRGVPRVALYRSWNGNMDEGWTRWVLEQLGVRYTTLTDSMARAGGLLQQFDVVILPDEGERELVYGRAANTAPAAMTGGLGDAGTQALRAFVEGGGTVIALDSAAGFAINRLGAAARLVRTSRGNDTTSLSRFYAPGSIFETAVDARHPLASGYRDRAAVYFISSVIMEAGPGTRVVAAYPAGRSPLLSGFIEGADVLSGKPALIDAPIGRGRAILFGFRPQHRGQTHGTFRLLTNAILYGAASAPGRAERNGGAARTTTGR